MSTNHKTSIHTEVVCARQSELKTLCSTVLHFSTLPTPLSILEKHCFIHLHSILFGELSYKYYVACSILEKAELQEGLVDCWRLKIGNRDQAQTVGDPAIVLRILSSVSTESFQWFLYIIPQGSKFTSANREASMGAIRAVVLLVNTVLTLRPFSPHFQRGRINDRFS